MTVLQVWLVSYYKRFKLYTGTVTIFVNLKHSYFKSEVGFITNYFHILAIVVTKNSYS